MKTIRKRRKDKWPVTHKAVRHLARRLLKKPAASPVKTKAGKELAFGRDWFRGFTGQNDLAQRKATNSSKLSHDEQVRCMTEFLGN